MSNKNPTPSDPRGQQPGATPDQPPYPPDWHYEDQYPGDETTLVQWGWEFLRRNPEYQSDYERFRTEPGEELEKSSQRHWQEKLQKYCLRRFIPPESPYSYPTARWFRRLPLEVVWHPGHHGPTLGKTMALAREYGIDDNFANLYPTIEVKGPGEIIIKFDVNLPIATQLEAARKILLKYKKCCLGHKELESMERQLATIGTAVKEVGIEQALDQLYIAMRKAEEAESKIADPRARCHLYRARLRLLDADVAGATLVEMADKIRPDPVQQRLKNAQKVFNKAKKDQTIPLNALPDLVSDPEGYLAGPGSPAVRKVQANLKAAKAIRDGRYRLLFMVD